MKYLVTITEICIDDYVIGIMAKSTDIDIPDIINKVFNTADEAKAYIDEFLSNFTPRLSYNKDDRIYFRIEDDEVVEMVMIETKKISDKEAEEYEDDGWD